MSSAANALSLTLLTISFALASASDPTRVRHNWEKPLRRSAASRQLQQVPSPASEDLTQLEETSPTAESPSAVRSGPILVDSLPPNGGFVAQLPPANRLENILLQELSPAAAPPPSAPLAPFTPGASLQYFGEQDPALNCSCTDTVPETAFSCQQIRFEERCDAVDEGLCDMTCGRCECCPSLLEMASRRGLDTFRIATEYLAEIEGRRSPANALRVPSYRGTVFVPTNAAFGRVLYLLNITLDTFLRQPLLLNQIVTYHALFGPVLAFSNDLVEGELGTSLITQNAASFLAVDTSEGNVKLQGVGSRSRIVVPNIYACQSLIHIVDEVLLPFSTDGFWE